MNASLKERDPSRILSLSFMRSAWPMPRLSVRRSLESWRVTVPSQSVKTMARGEDMMRMAGWLGDWVVRKEECWGSYNSQELEIDR